MLTCFDLVLMACLLVSLGNIINAIRLFTLNMSEFEPDLCQVCLL